MKKTRLMSSIVVFAFLVAFFLFYYISAMPKYAGNFLVDAFDEYIENENFQTDKNYGKITDYKSAAAAGKAAISDHFENADGGIFEWRGCNVKYDEKSDAYYIRTYQMFPPVFGGAYDVIIQSNGTVLAIWGEK